MELLNKQYKTPEKIVVEFVNLTPGPLDIDGIGLLRPSGMVARVITQRTKLPDLKCNGASIRVTTQVLGEVVNLPEPKLNTAYIVTGMVLSALKEHGSRRRDVFAPDTGPDATREGRVVTSVRGLLQ